MLVYSTTAAQLEVVFWTLFVSFGTSNTKGFRDLDSSLVKYGNEMTIFELLLTTFKS